MYETINDMLKANFYNNAKVQTELAGYEQDVLASKISPFTAAHKILATYLKQK